MHIGDQIAQHTGVRLAVGAGRGSLAEPIQLLTDDADEAMLAICGALDMIHTLSAKAWCLRAWPETDSELPGLLVAQTESNWIEGDQVMRDRRSWFFATANSSVANRIAEHTQLPTVAVGQSHVRLPVSIAWLNLRQVDEPQTSNPGAGTALHYASPGIQAELTVYDDGTPVPTGLDGEQRMCSAFYRMTAAITLQSPQCKALRSGALRSAQDELIWLFGDFKHDHGQREWLAIARLGQQLLKCRIRLRADEDAVYQNADESLQFLFRLPYREPLTAGPLPAPQQEQDPI